MAGDSGQGDYLLLADSLPTDSTKTRFYCARYKAVGRTVYMSLSMTAGSQVTCSTTRNYTHYADTPEDRFTAFTMVTDSHPVTAPSVQSSPVQSTSDFTPTTSVVTSSDRLETSSISSRTIETVRSTYDPVDTTINACSGSPCLNGGLCESRPDSTYVCQCEEGFTGETCSQSTPLATTQTDDDRMFVVVVMLVSVAAAIFLTSATAYCVCTYRKQHTGSRSDTLALGAHAAEEAENEDYYASVASYFGTSKTWTPEYKLDKYQEADVFY